MTDSIIELMSATQRSSIDKDIEFVTILQS